MKYKNLVTVNLSREEVIALFDDPENMKHWQEGFVSFESLSENPKIKGAKSRLKYKMGKRDVEMIETIVTYDLPEKFVCTYETKGVFNTIENYFVEVEENKTEWTTINEFQLSGMMKIFGWLMPGSFKKQSQKFLDDFKKFAEGN